MQLEDIMCTPVDRRILRSRKAILAAMRSLLEEKRPFAQITVSELADRAGVTRKTFYAHYGSPEDVVRAICWQLLESILSDIDEEHLILPISESGFAGALFNSVVSHKDLLQTTITRCPRELFLEPIIESMGRSIELIRSLNNIAELDSLETQCVTEMLGPAILGLITVWSRRNFEDSPEDMAGIFVRVLAPGIDRLYSESRKS